MNKFKVDTSKQKIYGGCACQSIRYKFSGNSVISYKCHCLDCQRASGSGAVAAMWIQINHFIIVNGELKYREIVADSGRKIVRGFCDICGSPILAKLEAPGVIAIFAMSLDEPNYFQPEYEIWTSRARSWEIINPSIQSFEKGFPSEIIRKHLILNVKKDR